MAGNKPFNKQTEPRERDFQVAGLKVPPHSIEAEQSVLGGLMLDNERWDDVAERVVSEDFYTRPHRHIFTEMARLQESGSPIDLITLAESLERQGQLDSVGGFAYLAELSKNTPSAANISAYADIVRERAVVREMISVANEIAEAGFDPQGRTSEDLLDLAESRVFKIAESRANKDEGPKNIADVLDATVARIEQLFQQPHDGVTGVNTGYDDLNKKTAGLQPSDLIIVAARPSMGKTTFAMNLVENAAMLQDKPVLIFSLEMPSEQIMMRSLASLSRVDQTRIRTGQLDDEDWARISGTMGILLDKRNIYIDDSSGLTPTEVRSRARRIAREHGGIGLIMTEALPPHGNIAHRRLRIDYSRPGDRNYVSLSFYITAGDHYRRQRRFQRSCTYAFPWHLFLRVPVFPLLSCRPQSVQHPGEFGRQIRPEFHVLSRCRMDEPKEICMQQLSLNAERILDRSVNAVPEERMIDVCHMYSDLMSPSRLETQFEKSIFPQSFQHLVMRDRLFLIQASDSLPESVAAAPADRLINSSLVLAERIVYYRFVAARRRMRRELGGQRSVGIVIFGDHQKTARVLVYAVHDAGTYYAVDRRKTVSAVMHYRIYQSPRIVARRRMHDHGFRSISSYTFTVVTVLPFASVNVPELTRDFLLLLARTFTCVKSNCPVLSLTYTPTFLPFVVMLPLSMSRPLLSVVTIFPSADLLTARSFQYLLVRMITCHLSPSLTIFSMLPLISASPISTVT